MVVDEQIYKHDLVHAGFSSVSKHDVSLPVMAYCILETFGLFSFSQFSLAFGVFPPLAGSQ